MKVLFIHNRTHPFSLERPFLGKCGGAALSNVAILQEAVRRHHQITFVFREGTSFLDAKPKEHDVAILSHLAGFPGEWVQEVMRSVPCVRWDHAYDYCRSVETMKPGVCSAEKCRSCKIPHYREVAATCILRVWQSPAHATASLACLGLPSGPLDYYLHPPIDTQHFCLHGPEKRDSSLSLFVGSASTHKGIVEAFEWFARRPKSERFRVVGDLRDEWPGRSEHMKNKRVSVRRGALNHEMPAEYRSAARLVHFPVWHEPSSRSVVEAYLCGCEVALNEKVGSRSFHGWTFDGSREDRERVRKDCEASPGLLWARIEGILGKMMRKKRRTQSC